MKTLRGPLVLAALVFFTSTSVPIGHIEAQTSSVAVVQSNQTVYTYPNGRYELRGDGTANNPYSWVWIPTGVQVVAAPPALPAPNVQVTQRFYDYPNGRYELRGDGTASNPYSWVWIPAGVQVVAAPPPPPAPNVRVTQRFYEYPEGRYELRGDGTASNPYSWVWIPAGTVSQPPPPPLPSVSRSGLKSVEGQIESVGFFGRSITLADGQEFDIPDWSAMATQPAVGQKVIVTYYVAQDGHNIVRSLDPNSGK